MFFCLFVCLHTNVKTVLFQLIQFSISSILPIDKTLLGATTLSQSGPGSDGTFAKLQHYWSFTIILFSVISRTLLGGVLLLCRDVVGVFCSPSRLSQCQSLLDYLMLKTVYTADRWRAKGGHCRRVPNQKGHDV